jgi:hypothetical protein
MTPSFHNLLSLYRSSSLICTTRHLALNYAMVALHFIPSHVPFCRDVFDVLEEMREFFVSSQARAHSIP